MISIRIRKVVANILIATMLTLEIPIVPTALAANIPASQWVTVPVKADPMMQNLTIPTDAATKGMWSGIQSWPLNGLHAGILPDGRVLSYGTSLTGNAQDGRYLDVWDPSMGFGDSSHNTNFRATQQDNFCGTATYMNDGRLLLSGGNGNRLSTLFAPSTNSVTTPSYTLAFDRWYATMINLPDGRPIMLGGMVPYNEANLISDPNVAIAQGLANMTPEVLESTGWRTLFGANSRLAFGPDYLRTSYPRAWVAPDGQIFGISADQMWYLDPNGNSGNGVITSAGTFKGPYSATTPINVGSTNSAVMFAPGKILLVGGNGGYNGDELPASNKATVIDINSGTPVLTEQPAMTYARRYSNAIVLANGQVVITGGTTYGNLYSGQPGSGVYNAEIWNPDTGSWTVGANAAVLRVYHSQTSLLPNGTILSTGGGAPGPVNNLNAEIYYPPYLFKSVNGVSQLATRPVIKAISGLSYDNNAMLQLDMVSSSPISQLVLVGLSNGTHSFNTSQRRIPLSFTQEGIRLTTTLPNANTAPPGYYQVVTLDANGVPSLGAIVGIGQNVAAPVVTASPYTPPDVSGTISAPIISTGGTANYTVTAVAGVTYSWNFGDGTADTPYNANPAVTHSYAQAGAYVVTLSAKDSNGIISRRTYIQAVATAKTANSPTSSTAIALESRTGNPARVWVINPDNDSVSVIDTSTNALVAEITVGTSPRNVAIAPDGRIWVTNKNSASISVISPTTLTVVQTIALPRASQPHGLAFSPNGSNAFVVLEATGQLLKLDPATGAQLGAANVGANVRHISIGADSTTLMVSRFITPPLPGESTATIDTTTAGAEIVVANASSMVVTKTITLKHSDKVDNETQGSGIPNYLAAAVISPDGTTAWVPSKQDNIKRGMARSGQNLDFQNTIRAISSRIDMSTLSEDYAKRIDHDNSSLGSAAVYHPSGVYMFVALETSRQVAVVDAIGGRELFKINVGRAPQGLTISADGNTLYVHEFMDRSVSVIDLTPLTINGNLTTNIAAITYTITNEKLPAQVVLGKQLFYDAKDVRLARDSYMSCASCHNDGGHDGRVWDLTGFGEGLRNTIALNGRAGMGHGFLHWSANFDEVQDFEKQIRTLAGGTGLMSDTDFNTGTRNQPLGDAKAGVSVDLDELAAYVSSLSTFAQTPYRNTDGSLTAAASAGRTVFNNSCASCHNGNAFTLSSDANNLKNVGTINSLSGQRLGATLTGLDVPTLRDTWATAPYLHNGSASTITAAVQAHNNVTLNATDLANVVAYVQQIGVEEAATSGTGTGTGLLGQYYANVNLSGTSVLQRTETINFNWGMTSPGAGVPVDNFSIRWSGQIEAISTGAYQFQTNSDDGVRVWVNGQLLIDNWTPHGATLDTSTAITLTAGQKYNIIVQYFDSGFDAVMQLLWKKPGDATFTAVPATQLYNTTIPNVAPTVSLTAPANNATVTQGATVAITANATDSDGSISKVEFYDGTTLLSTSTSAPYSYNWLTSTAGTHTLTAKAYDDQNAVTTSAAVNVTVNASVIVPGTGAGLLGQYFANVSLSGTAVLQPTEAVNFDWGLASPGAGVPVDNFSVRWSGQVEAPSTGTYQFRTNSDDGVRVYVNNVLVINNWTNHGATLNTSANITLTAGQKYAIVVEYYDSGYDAVIQLFWKTPIDTTFSVIPATRLY